MISTDDLHTFLRSRRSVRRFRPDPVPDSALERILDTATHAPSAHDRQPWRFRVITSARTKSCLADAMGSDFRRDLAADGVSQEKIDAQVKRSRERILSAPVVILLCMDLSHMDAYPDPGRAGAERTMATQSVAAAGSHLLLAAHAEGLGGVWVCSPLFTPQTVQQVLDLPRAWEPQAMFFVGYSDDVSKPKNLRALPEIALFDQG